MSDLHWSHSVHHDGPSQAVAVASQEAALTPDSLQLQCAHQATAHLLERYSVIFK
jgi:hypothetical protein